jgi:hypothetical protein
MPRLVASPAPASSELLDRPRRRTFIAQTGLRILAEIDGGADTGRIGAILRREGLYSSLLFSPLRLAPTERRRRVQRVGSGQAWPECRRTQSARGRTCPFAKE